LILLLMVRKYRIEPEENDQSQAFRESALWLEWIINK
jgi:hypothetical protein